jgi:hypothetical protein
MKHQLLPVVSSSEWLMIVFSIFNLPPSSVCLLLYLTVLASNRIIALKALWSLSEM